MARPRDYSAEARRRNELARERGFRSYGAQRAAPRYPRSGREYGRLPEDARVVRSDALRVIDLADREGLSVQQAASRLGVPMRTVRYWAGEALGPSRHGRSSVTENDDLMRLRPIALDGRLQFAPTANRREAREATHIFDVQWRYAHGRATRAELDRLPRTFMGQRVLKDPDQLLRLGLAGGLVPGVEDYEEALS